MKSLIPILSLTTIIFFESCSQNCDKYKTHYQPNTTYNSLMTSTSKSIVNYEGSEKVIAHLLSKGYSKTSVIDGKNILKTITNTSKSNSSEDFKLQFEIIQSKGTQIKNGKPFETENSELLNLKLYGHCTLSGPTTIDSVKGKNLNESLRKAFMLSFSSLNDLTLFPEKCLSVGESFDKESELEIPMDGFDPINFNVITKYTLTKKEKKLAFFNIEQIYEMRNSTEKMKVELSANGNGTGKIIIDSENNFMTYYESKTDFSYLMKFGELTMKVQQIATTIQKTLITKR